MPTYEYLCPKCGHEFEQFQSMKDEPLKRCPQCRKLGLKRLVGAGAGLIFKGTGFYITDYKKTGSPESVKAEGEKRAAGEGKPAPDAAKAAKAAEPAKTAGETKPAKGAKDKR
jgi:putative FmdB family regulatory protein